MTKAIDFLEKNSSSEARSVRIKYLRKKLGLTQRTIEDKYQIPVKSLQNWERVRYSGLSAKSAERLAKAFIAEGLQCDPTYLITWMLYGGEPDPTMSHSIPNPIVNWGTSEEAKIAEELKLFHSLYKNTIDATIMDNSLAPWFTPGDRVAGIQYSPEEIHKAVGMPCIIMLHSKEIVIRVLESATKPGYFNLTGTHPDSATIEDVWVLSVAPVIWVRKPNKI